MSHKHNEFRNRKYVLRFNKTHYGYFLNHSFRFLSQEQFSFFLQTIKFKSECKMNIVQCTLQFTAHNVHLCVNITQWPKEGTCARRVELQDRERARSSRGARSLACPSRSAQSMEVS